MIIVSPYSSLGNTQNQAFSAYLETYFPDSDYLMYRHSMYVSYCYVWHGDTADALLIYNSDTSSFTVSIFEYSGFSVSDTSLVLFLSLYFLFSLLHFPVFLPNQRLLAHLDILSG